MKILCIIDSLGSGGAQRQLVNLAKGFKGRGHEVSFLVYHSQDFYKEELEHANININYIIEPNYLKRLLGMRRFIRKGNFDSVLSFLEASNFIATMSGFPYRNWKLIVGERSANPNILKSFKLRFYRWIHLFTDYVVANSHENLKIVKKINPLLQKSNCKVIYNTIDLNKWKPLKDFKQKDQGRLRIIVAASHRRLKNLNNFIEAVNLLTNEDKESIIIEWYGDERDDSLKMGQQKIETYGLNSIFRFYPATTDFISIVQNANVIGLFSLYEGLPNAICEGMACGKPIISSVVSDIEILVSKENGFLFNPTNVTSIQNSIKELIDSSPDDLTNMGRESRKRAEELFNSERIIDNYLKLMSNSK